MKRRCRAHSAGAIHLVHVFSMHRPTLEKNDKGAGRRCRACVLNNNGGWPCLGQQQRQGSACSHDVGMQLHARGAPPRHTCGNIECNALHRFLVNREASTGPPAKGSRLKIFVYKRAFRNTLVLRTENAYKYHSLSMLCISSPPKRTFTLGETLSFRWTARLAEEGASYLYCLINLLSTRLFFKVFFAKEGKM